MLKMPNLAPEPLIPAYHGLRTNQYMYEEYQEGWVELYDLVNDPYELENIASSADPQLLEKFSAWLKDMSTCSGESCLQIESRQNIP
jgi:hypothetical protein